MNEDQLFRAYTSPTRVVPCACGGLLAAFPNDERSVEMAVVAHQETYRHREWLVRRFEDGSYIIARVVETSEGTFLEPLQAGTERVP